jgi:hypothetical protein
MKEVRLTPIRDRYPITAVQLRMGRIGNPLRSFEERMPPANFELGLGAFTDYPDYKLDRFRQARIGQIQLLMNRGYTTSNKPQDDETLARFMGVNPDRFGSGQGALGGEFSRGIPYAFHMGNIEAQQAAHLVDMIRRNSQREVNRVLNMGCGSVGFQHVNLEGLGIDKITYADINNLHAPGDPKPLELLADRLKKMGRPDVERTYLTLNKDDIGAVCASIPANSIGAVIRTGVGNGSPTEMAGLRHAMTADGELYASNSIVRQPIGPFLDLIEGSFENVQVDVGLARYSVVCGRPKPL